MAKVIDSTNLGYLIGKIKAAFWPKTDVVQIDIDSTPTDNSTNLVTSGGVKDALDDKQDTLESGTNIKTINNESLLGSGNISIQGGSSVEPATANPSMDGTVAVGSSAKYAREDHVHPRDTSKQDVIDSSHKLPYSLISDTPTIPAAQVQSDWNATSGMGVILNKPTIPTVPTISTDISADATSNTKTASPKAVKDYVDVPIVTSYPSGGFRPNKIYDLGSQTGSKTYALYTTGLDTTVKNEWVWSFVTGSTAPTITWPSPTGMKWDGGSAPTINSNCLYEISIRRIGSYYVGYYKEIEL